MPPKDGIHTGLRRVYTHYRYRAQRCNLKFSLTVLQFKKLVEGACTYCGTPPQKLTKGYKWNGIDRKDSSDGYIPDNCVPCCTFCNLVKSNILSHEEMLIAMQAVLSFRALKKEEKEQLDQKPLDHGPSQ